LFFYSFGGDCVAVQSNPLTTALGTLSTSAGNAVSDLSGVVAGADVLASQFADVKVALQNLQSLAATMSDSGFYTPVGSIVSFAGAAAPDGWLLCNGVTVPNGSGTVQSQTRDYSVLYGVLAGAYGGAGKLPDLQGRTIVGIGTNGAVDVLGDNEGIDLANVADRSPLHKHSNNLTVNSGGIDHSHEYELRDAGSIGINNGTDRGARMVGGNARGGFNTYGASAYLHTHPMGGSVGTGAATNPNDTMPFLTLNYIIKS
jgi:microcystin-dependent protein